MLLSFSRKKAFSLVELLLVLGVIAALLVGAFLIYPQVRDRNQARNEAQNIQLIQAQVRNIFASKGGSYEGLGRGKSVSDRGIANQAKIFPSSMNGGDYSQNAVISSSWGGQVYVWRNPNVTTPKGDIPWAYSFGILYEQVPQGVCVHLLPALAGSFVSVKINSTEILDAKGQINMAELGKACATSNGTLVLTSE